MCPLELWSLTYGGDDGQRVEKRTGERPPIHLLVGALVTEVTNGFDDVALKRPEVHLNFTPPFVLVVLGATRQVPQPSHGTGPVRGHPVDDRLRVARRALDEYEHKGAGDHVADHQAYDADVAEQERDELPQVVFALLRPRLLPLVVVPPAAPFPFHDGTCRYSVPQ